MGYYFDNWFYWRKYQAKPLLASSTDMHGIESIGISKQE